MTTYLRCLIVVALCCSAHSSSIAIVCEDSSMYLSCPPGQELDVHSGVYGRTQGNKICPHHSIFTTNCVSKISTAKVQKMCNGKNTCRLHASSLVFGEPCGGIYKYLQVEYSCLDKF